MFSKISFLAALAQLGLTVLATGPSPRLTTPELSRLINKNYIRPVRTSSYDSGPVLQYVEMPVNHLDDSSDTFLNRYWVDDYYYQTGGPVFFIDNGEASAEGMDQYLREGASGSLAETFNGLLILWEHRFYGSSMPNMTADMQFEPAQLEKYLQYHTIEQALEDVAVFARGFSYDGLPGVDLKPGNVPWVFVGGSYPGARAAWIRIRNPEIFHASLASSAVVELQENFWQYYRVIENTMENSGYANCSSDMRALAAYIDDAFTKQNGTAIDSFMNDITGPKSAPLYRYFHFDDLVGANNTWENRMTNVRAAIQVMFQDFQYVGMDGYLGLFCDTLQVQASGRNNLATIQSSSGIFSDYDTPTAVSTYAEVLAVIWGDALTPSDYPSPGATTANSGQYDCAFDQETCQAAITQYSWMYQVCSEFGAFQVTNSSRPSSLLPKIESVDNWVKDCITYFGDTVADGPNLAPVDKKYKGWNMSPSNVMFNDGELDPWRAVTLHSVEDNSPKRQSTTDIPANGQAPGGNKFFGYVVQGGFHCPDLGNVAQLKNTTSIDPSDSTNTQTSANTAHTLFISALNSWLPAFKKHTISNNSTISTSDVSNGGAAGGTGSGSNTTKKNSAPASNMASIQSVFYSMLISLIVYSVI